MKHSLQITIILLSIFVISQIMGLALINRDIKLEINPETGQTETMHPETALGERPKIEGGMTFGYFLMAILIGTGLLLLIIKFGKEKIWKTWYVLAVFLAMSLAFGVILSKGWAFIVAALLTSLKIWKNNILTHNLTEILIYSGIAILFVPLLNIGWMILLLLVVSIYDVYAVIQSKHMIKLAKFQVKLGTFAGLYLPYKKNKEKVLKKIKVKKAAEKEIRNKRGKKAEKSKKKSKKRVKGIRTAVLGGGDITFPLLFGGVVMESLINQWQLTKLTAFFYALIIPLMVTIALGFLLVKGKEKKFYPAMPWVTSGCLAGYGLILLLLI